MIGKPQQPHHRAHFGVSRTNFSFLVLLPGGILFELRDLGGQQFRGLVGIGHFLPLVLLRHGGRRHDAR